MEPSSQHYTREKSRAGSFDAPASGGRVGVDLGTEPSRDVELELHSLSRPTTDGQEDQVSLLQGRHSDAARLDGESPRSGGLVSTNAGEGVACCRGRCGQWCRKYSPCRPDDGGPNIFSRENMAIPVFYATLGFLMKFPYVALRFYLRDTLRATPAQQAIVYAVVLGMPWNFKMFYGFISDSCPIRGQRRKPYMVGGTVLCSASWLLFGMWHTPTAPGMGLTCLFLFTAVLGMIFADVMADALVVERMKLEPEDQKGGIQATCWMLRFSGAVAGFLVGGWLMEYAAFAPQSIFFLQGLVPLGTMLPPLYFLRDDAVRSHQTASEAAREKVLAVWDCVQYNHIWMPLCFIFAFAATPSNGDAFANFLLGPLCFSDAEYTYLLAVGMASQLLGTWIYKKYLRAVPFRRLFCVTIVFAACVSATQLVLVTGANRSIGLPDFLFALGDEVVIDAASFIVQMPTLVICAALCPPGVESTLYALMTVANNIALSVGGSISSALADAFGITLENFDNLWALTLLTCLSSLLPTLLIPLTPRGTAECAAAASATKGTRRMPQSRYGGAGFLSVLFVGLLYSIVNAGIKLSAGGEETPGLETATLVLDRSASILSSSPAVHFSFDGALPCGVDTRSTGLCGTVAYGGSTLDGTCNAPVAVLLAFSPEPALQAPNRDVSISTATLKVPCDGVQCSHVRLGTLIPPVLAPWTGGDVTWQSATEHGNTTQVLEALPYLNPLPVSSGSGSQLQLEFNLTEQRIVDAATYVLWVPTQQAPAISSAQFTYSGVDAGSASVEVQFLSEHRWECERREAAMDPDAEAKDDS